MPDILTHVLAAYVVATLLSARYKWLTPSYVTVAMVGALLPDVTKVSLVLPSAHVEAWLGVPFDWFALHTLGGCVVAAAIGGLLTTAGHRRRRVVGLLLFGAVSHLVLDGLLVKPSGRAAMLWWPLTTYHLPTPGLYLSTDRWPAAVALATAAVVWFRRRRDLTRWRD